MQINKNIKPYTIDENESIRAAIKKIDKNESGIIFCIDGEWEFKGLISDGDIRRWLIEEGNPNINIPLKNIINKSCVKASIDESPRKVELLLNKVSRAVPLLNQNGILVAVAFKNLGKFEIGNKKIGDKYPCFIIAEIGNNHQGNLEMAKTLIEEASKAGADCAKFQMRDTQKLYKLDKKGNSFAEDLGTQYTLDLLSKYQLTNEELFEAFDYCKKLNIEPLCTPWDLTSLSALEEYGLNAYKIASADLTNHELLKEVCKTGKPIICSTGMSTEFEIKEAVSLLKERGGQFALLQCNSTYPAPYKDINLKYMEKLKTIGQCPIGYSSHDRGINIVTAATALGANIIEKHFTLDRNLEGNDHRVSLLPNELTQMIISIKQVELALGNSNFRDLSQGELINKETLGKSIFISTSLKKGDLIKNNMLTIRSPGSGLSPNRKNEIVGKVAMRDLNVGDMLYPSDLGEGLYESKNYTFENKFGIPIRYHDLDTLAEKSNFDLLEFHLSYKDIQLDLNKYLSKSHKKDLVVHAPELFEGDHILDLCSLNNSYREKSIRHLKEVVKLTKELSKYFSSKKPLIVLNVGGFTEDAPLEIWQRKENYDLVYEALKSIDLSEVEIIPQTMPPFPWHFGGQRYHNLFVDPNEINEFCKKTGFRVCLDISHSKLACNHFNWSFENFLKIVCPNTVHLHIADASGIDGEGLQIGEGEIDFVNLKRLITTFCPNASFIPEIWQGHKNEGKGFWEALHKLERHFK